jgi:hypothetical protein
VNTPICIHQFLVKTHGGGAEAVWLLRTEVSVRGLPTPRPLHVRGPVLMALVGYTAEDAEVHEQFTWKGAYCGHVQNRRTRVRRVNAAERVAQVLHGQFLYPYHLLRVRLIFSNGSFLLAVSIDEAGLRRDMACTSGVA